MNHMLRAFDTNGLDIIVAFQFRYHPLNVEERQRSHRYLSYLNKQVQGEMIMNVDAITF